jgi:hypothetical protein
LKINRFELFSQHFGVRCQVSEVGHAKLTPDIQNLTPEKRNRIGIIVMSQLCVFSII